MHQIELRSVGNHAHHGAFDAAEDARWNGATLHARRQHDLLADQLLDILDIAVFEEEELPLSGDLPDVPHHCVVMDPVYNQNIYAGSDLGIYVTTNSGANWHEYRAGMPYALAFDITVVYPNRKLRVATYGNGIYERKLLENPVSVNPVSNENVTGYSLSQNYPNPFNPSTHFEFIIPVSGFVSLKIYDITGKEVRTLLNEIKPAGIYQLEFKGEDLPSGVYYYKIESGKFSQVKKMVLIK